MSTDGSPIHILLADDDSDDVFFFQRILHSSLSQSTLRTVGDGQELIKLLTTTAVSELPDYLFLDINMPRKSGIECLAEIRKDKKLDSLVIIMFSTSTNFRDVNQSYELGANRYLSKELFFIECKHPLEKIFSVAPKVYLEKIPKSNFLLSREFFGLPAKVTT